ncbi:MAG: AbrB/MazE/SpoVT family DNA-binding domain-containing protein [Spirochaetota bacterium]
MKTIVSERGQITLPKALRINLGIKPGTVLQLDVQDGKLLAWKKDDIDSIHKWRGKGQLPAGFENVDDYLQATRG